jgi:hypothetical protein
VSSAPYCIGCHAATEKGDQDAKKVPPEYFIFADFNKIALIFSKILLS